MFTGIIRHVGQVLDARDSGGLKRLTIDLGPLAENLSVGDSVAVSGVCLTVCAADGSRASFDVVAETLWRTMLGGLRARSKVNLERSLRAGDALDGHLVQGHVDGLAKVKAVHRGAQWRVEFAAAKELTDQMVPKGSIAIDGVSLTLVDVADGEFSVALVPATLAGTSLADLKVGDAVNVETDVIGKYVRRCLRGDAPASSPGGLTLEKLKDAGFA
jgi:riboflavin synthase